MTLPHEPTAAPPCPRPAPSTARPVTRVGGLRRWRLPLLLATAAATVAATPLAVNAVTPAGATDDSPLPAAADGSLACGEGYAAAIAPASADLRLLPGELPEGWTTTSVFARSVDERGYCGLPSLTALRTDGDLVTGRLAVSGPFTDPLALEGDGEPVDDTVAGRPAERHGVDDGEAGAADSAFRWTWQDADGQHWLAEVEGFALAEAQAVLAGLATDGDQVTWDTAAAPELEVVHQRTASPYEAEREYLEWYVELGGAASEALGGDEVDGEAAGSPLVDVSHDPAAAVPLVATAQVGARLVNVDGLEALVYESEGEQSPDGEPLEPGGWLQVELAPGTVAATATRADWQTAASVLASLEHVPADDERLARYSTEDPSEDGESAEPTG